MTGVPGSGKTLVGLDIVSKNLKKGNENLSVYLSGNGPLVEVLRKALIKSARIKNKYGTNTEKAINGFIQSSYSFKRDVIKNNYPTAENILVFDEAQRVWNQEKMAKKHDDLELHVSEPSLLYRVMDRHDDWAVIVCLVGLGQDIYDGEAGINEWFNCGINEFSSWEMFYSPDIFNQNADQTINENVIRSCKRCHEFKDLHLRTSIRSFRADKQSQFIDSLLDNDSEKASKLYDIISPKYPIYVTRDFKKAKYWTRSQVRGSQRCGVLASSGASRLIPEGIFVPRSINVTSWFLSPNNNIYSSNMMEVVAREFDVQGLEIDWSVVCWDANLRRENGDWGYYKFGKTKWNPQKKEDLQRYLKNSYRVLLTRARQGMVIFVPLGVDTKEDPTRNHKFYDEIYKYLVSCGIKDLSDAVENKD